ncbi:hypothetical protein NDU88_005629 [Pleurodeles waltl]|uniref:Uncharacterized protein n=1 Tax=Pleurodeles waltl TaxID=8319 RepID=A0AAV7RPR5_PLEWA|nr:hypothetical protein NDU88_005629 [Pleurodeles waltl]
MTPDFRVPAEQNVDDGLHKEEEIEDGTEDARRTEEETDAEGQRGEGGAGNSDVPNQKTGPMRTNHSEETRNHRHAPGGTWLNKKDQPTYRSQSFESTDKEASVLSVDPARSKTSCLNQLRLRQRVYCIQER